VSDHVIDPLRRSWVVAHHHTLDVGRMNEASLVLIGEHDFAAFCREREGTSSVRTLQGFDWSRTADGLVVARLSADAFCHSMVRSLVGALLPVGDGRRPITWPAELLAARWRDPAVTVAPPHGLVFEAVDYPQDSELAAQAQAARRWRGDPDLNPNRS
jgi:tRNA pseudouridine38-40 synthase